MSTVTRRSLILSGAGLATAAFVAPAEAATGRVSLHIASAGFIFGRLVVGGWDAAVAYGAALSALKHSIPGDFSLSTREEVELVLKGAGLRVAR